MGIKIIKPVIRNECAGFFVGTMLRQHSCLPHPRSGPGPAGRGTVPFFFD